MFWYILIYIFYMFEQKIRIFKIVIYIQNTWKIVKTMNRQIEQMNGKIT